MMNFGRFVEKCFDEMRIGQIVFVDVISAKDTVEKVAGFCMAHSATTVAIREYAELKDVYAVYLDRTAYYAMYNHMKFGSEQKLFNPRNVFFNDIDRLDAKQVYFNKVDSSIYVLSDAFIASGAKLP